MMYDYKPAEEIIRELMPAGPEFVERDIGSQFQRYQEDPSNTTPALEVLIAVFAAALEDEDQNPHRSVSLPLWVAQAFGPGLKAYLDDPDIDGLSLEQRLGIRSSKPGGHSQIDKEETQWRWRHIALEVGLCRGPDPARGDTVKAMTIVAEKRNISEEAVKKAWEIYKVPAMEALIRNHAWDQLDRGKKHP